MVGVDAPTCAGGLREALLAAANRCVIGKNIFLWEDLSSHRGLVRKGVSRAAGLPVSGGFPKVACGCLFCTAGAVFSSFRWHLDFPKFKMHFGKVHLDMGEVKIPPPLGSPWPPLGAPWAPFGAPLDSFGPP